MKTLLIATCLLSICFQEIFSQKLRGFHFNKDRPVLWSKPSHELNKNSSWVFNFEEYGNCLRLDVPLELPKKFTFCYKVNHDFTDAFTFLNLVSTKSGKSAVEELRNNL